MDAVLKYLSSYRFIFSLCTVAAAAVIWVLLRHVIHRFTARITASDALKGRQQTYLTLALSCGRGLLVLVALILILQIHGVNVTSLVAGLGIVGAIVGLALQDMLKDVIMGLNILAGEYFMVGDVVKYGEVTGEVMQFSLRSTQLRDLATDNIVTISNRNIFEIARVSDEIFLPVSTSYSDDPTAMEAFLGRLAEEINTLPDVESCTMLGLTKLGDWSVDYLLRIQAQPTAHNAVRRRALELIRHRFLENGFTIPYPQMDVHTS